MKQVLYREAVLCRSFGEAAGVRAAVSKTVRSMLKSGVVAVAVVCLASCGRDGLESTEQVQTEITSGTYPTYTTTDFALYAKPLLERFEQIDGDRAHHLDRRLLQLLDRELTQRARIDADYGQLLDRAVVAQNDQEYPPWHFSRLMERIVAYLGRTGDPRGLPFLERIWELADQSPRGMRIEERAISAAAEIGSRRALPLLLRGLCERQPVALEALIALGFPVGAYATKGLNRLEPPELGRRLEALWILADERHAERMAHPAHRDDETLWPIRLTRRDVNAVAQLGDDPRPPVRYGVARVLASWVANHPGDGVAAAKLRLLADDNDPSVRAAAQGSAEGALRRIPGCNPVDNAPANIPFSDFEAQTGWTVAEDTAFRAGIERSEYWLVAPEFRCNDPVWIRIETAPTLEGCYPTRVGSMRVRVRDPIGRESAFTLEMRPTGWCASGAVWHIYWPIDDPAAQAGGAVAVHAPGWSHRKPRGEGSVGYVNLAELTDLRPGRWQVMVELNHGHAARTEPLDVLIHRGWTDETPEKPSREVFNPHRQNPFVRELWSSPFRRPYSGQYPVMVLGRWLYVGDEKLAAYDPATGWRRWVRDVPCMNLRLDDGRLHVRSRETIPQAKPPFAYIHLILDADSGALLEQWREQDHEDLSAYAQPQSRVSMGVRYRVDGPALVAEDEVSGGPLWSMRVRSRDRESTYGRWQPWWPVVDEGVVFVVKPDGYVYAFQNLSGVE